MSHPYTNAQPHHYPYPNPQHPHPYPYPSVLRIRRRHRLATTLRTPRRRGRRSRPLHQCSPRRTTSHSSLSE